LILMAEEKQEKKKSGIIRRILKWIGLAVLSLLLILAIFFQAPWKVITLFAIILAACTILPKHLRKWFWLSAAAVVVVLIIWVFLPDDDEGWRPYTFDEELAALEAKYAIPDGENVAISYNQLLEDYNEAAFKPYFRDPNVEYLTRSKPWLSNDYPQVAEWLRSHENTIAKLIEASKFEKCRFPIVADVAAYAQHIEIFAPMRRCAFLLICASNNDLAEGRFDQSIEKNLAVLQMAKHICQQPIMIDMLVRIAIEELAIKQFNRFIVTGDATEEHLNVIEKAVAEIKHEWCYDWPRILEGEKLLTKSLFGMFYEVNSKGKVRLNRDPTAAIRAQFPQEISPLTYWQKKLLKASAILGWFFMPSTPQKAAKIIDDSFKKYYAMAEPDFDWDKEPSEFRPRRKVNYRTLVELLTNCPGSRYYRIHEIYLRDLAYRRGSRLLVAIKQYHIQHGVWPDNLDAIKSLAPADAFIDPVNGKKFTYENYGEHFSLYAEAINIWPK